MNLSPEIQWHIKTFEELSTHTLYSILKLRMATFIVEQKCIYLDMDDMDQSALHLYAVNSSQLIAYARIQLNLPQHLAIIRRVIVHQDYRNIGLGKTLMVKALNYINAFKTISMVELSAQFHLKKFYESLGFQIKSKPYLDTEILHVKMVKIFS